MAHAIFTYSNTSVRSLLQGVTLGGTTPSTAPILICAPIPERQILIAQGTIVALLFEKPDTATTNLFTNGQQAMLKFPYSPTQTALCPVQLSVFSNATSLLIMAMVLTHTLTLPLLVLPLSQGGSSMTTSLPTDGGQHPAIGIYVPGVGVVAAGGISVQTDSNGTQYAILNTNATLNAASLAIADASITTHTLTVDASGKIGVSSLPSVTGTVTANIGTAGSLALETGGNLAAIKTDADTIVTNTGNIPAKGQGTMANSLPVVIASNQTPVSMSSPTSATGTITSVPAATSSTQILASNSSRKGAYFQNDGSALLSLAFAGSASTTAYTVQIPAGGFFEMPTSPVYTGAIFGIWSAVSGAVRVTELT